MLTFPPPRFRLPDCSTFDEPFSKWCLLLTLAALRHLYRPTLLLRRALDWDVPIASAHIYALLGSYAEAVGEFREVGGGKCVTLS